jgi:glutathione S-transferase
MLASPSANQGATDMSLTFYYSPMSTASITDLVLEELGVPCERVRLDLQKGDTRKPEYLRVNPNGKVPTIVHEGTPIWESSAITLYLGEVFGVEKKLFPGPGPKRGEAMKWIIWTHVTLGDAVMRLFRNTAEWVPAEQRNAKAGEAAQADTHGALRILDEALAGKNYLLGEYTLTDTHVNSFIDWLRHMKTDLSAYSNLNGWGQRCAARPAYKTVMSRT